MKIAILTTDSYFSCRLISEIVEKRTKEIAAVVITPSKVKGKGTLSSAWHIYKKTGFRNLLYKIVASLWVYFAEFLYKTGFIKHCITPSNLAEKFNIELFKSKDCNDELTYNYLKEKNIDIILSINVYQRIKENILALPKITAINNHFGLLPKYKGMGPYIWAMSNGEKQIGMTVHHMVLEFDEGRIIEQKTLEIEPNDSAMGVYLRGCEIAKHMICDAVAEVENDPQFGFVQQGEGSYYSMPTRECISKFYKRGYKLWTFKDLFLVLKKSEIR
jgi:methionyl-tRNA formyltransferase